MFKKILTISAVAVLTITVTACEEDLLTANPEETVFENPEPTIEIEDEIGFGERNNEDVDIVEDAAPVIPTEGDKAYLYLVLDSSIAYAAESEGSIETIYDNGEPTLTLYNLPESNGVNTYLVNDDNELELVDSDTSTLNYLKKVLIESQDEDCVSRLNYSEFVVSVTNDDNIVEGTYTVNVREGIATDIFVQQYDETGGSSSANHINIQYGFTDEDVANFPGFN